MSFGQYAHLDMHRPVMLTKQEVENLLPPQDKDEYEAAPMQEVGEKPILLFHKPPANDNKKPDEPENTPDQAETALQDFYVKLSPQLKKVMAANGNFRKHKHRPNRTALKTAHAPKPAQAATKSVASKPLEKIVEFYLELNEANAAPSPRKANPQKQNHGSLRLLHTVEAVIEELPKLEQDNLPMVHGILLAAKLAGLAA